MQTVNSIAIYIYSNILIDSIYYYYYICSPLDPVLNIYVCLIITAYAPNELFLCILQANQIRNLQTVNGITIYILNDIITYYSPGPGCLKGVCIPL